MMGLLFWQVSSCLWTMHVIILCNFLMLDDLLDAISIQYGMGNFLGPLWFVSESSILQGFNEATIFVLFCFFFWVREIS
jgi:hypothetical protein